MNDAAAGERRARIGRGLVRLLASLGLALVFMAASVLAIALQLDTPRGHRLLATSIGRVLDATFEGSFTIGGIERVTLERVVAAGLVVKDPQGRVVLTASRLTAHAPLLAIAKSVLLGRGDVTVDVDHVQIDRAEAHWFAQSGTAAPSLARAFTLRPSSNPKGPATSGRSLRLQVRTIELSHGYAQGAPLGLPPLQVELSQVRGSVSAIPERTEVTLARFGLVAHGLGAADVKGVASFRLLVPGYVWTSFDGYVGDVQVGSILRVDGEHVSARVDLPRAMPEQLRALLPGVPLTKPLSLHAEADGVFSRLATRARLDIGETRGLVSGTLALTDGAAADLELAAEAVDLSDFADELPVSDFDGRATVRLRSQAGRVALQTDVITTAGHVAGFQVPSAQIRAELRDGLLTGHAQLAEPGSPIRVAFARKPDGSADLTAEATNVRLDARSRLGKLVKARGSGDLRVIAHLQHGELSADVNAALGRFERGGVQLARATVNGRVRGSTDRLAQLDVNATFSAEQPSFAGVSFAHATGSVRGSLAAPTVQLTLSDSQARSLRAQARVRPRAGGAELRDLMLALTGAEGELHGEAKRFEVSADGLAIEGLDLRGAGGTLTGSLTWQRGLATIDARGDALDLRRLATLVGLPTHLLAGKLSFTAEASLARDLERGRITAKLEEASLGPLDAVSSTFSAELADRHIALQGDLAIRGVGRSEVRAALDVPGSVRDWKTLRASVGTAELDLEDFDLGALGAAVAPGRALPAAGRLGAVVRLSRLDPRQWPDVAITAGSAGLELDTSYLIAGGPRISGVDARFGAHVSGATGESELSVQLVDTRGLLASASLSTSLDLGAVVDRPARLLNELATRPSQAKLLIEERPLEQLPASIQPPGVAGRLRAELTLSGSLAEPTLAGRVRISHFALAGGDVSPELDLCATLGFERASFRFGSRGELFLSSRDREVCTGPRVANYSLSAALEPNAHGARRLTGNAILALDGAPLEAIPLLAEAGIAGRASGAISLDQSGSYPALVGNLKLQQTSMHDAVLGEGRVEIRTNEQAFGATVELASGDGHVDVTALAALDYSGLVPKLREQQPIGIRVTASSADATLLAPLTRDLFSEIAGRFDANVNLALQPPHAKDDSWTGKIDGDVALHQGTLELAGLGLRLYDTEISARAATEGDETRVDFGDISARAGRARQALRIHEGALWLKRLELARASGTLEATDLPIVVQGVPLATATTRQSMRFDVERTPTAMVVRVDVPYLAVALPQTGARELISLEENRSIVVLQPLGAPTRSSGPGLPWRFEFTFGRNVKLTRSDLELPLTGHAQLVLAEETTVTGDLELLAGGRVDTSGRTFVIETGDVHFDTGDPGNPRIHVAAIWRAPDGTIVNAELNGTLKDARLNLSSPGRTLPEIYALLLGGSTAEGAGTDPRATGAAVGADRLLGPLLANTPLRRFELRAGSERTADQRTYSTYSAAVPIGDQLWFEGSYKSLSSSEVTDQAAASTAWSGTVDWRFRRNWSLRTELGSIGAGVDLVWNHRY